MQTVTCRTAGYAKGDPGPATIEVIITDETGTVIHEEARSIGNSTSDYAAYYAVLAGLEAMQSPLALELSRTVVSLELANATVASALRHETPVTDPGLVPLFVAIHNLRVTHFPQIQIITTKPTGD